MQKLAIVLLAAVLTVSWAEFCNICHPSGYACDSESTYRVCTGGRMLGKSIPCDYGLNCTDNPQICGFGRPACTYKCGRCNDERTMACMGPKKFALCHGKLAPSNVIIDCPGNGVCNNYMEGDFCAPPTAGYREAVCKEDYILPLPPSPPMSHLSPHHTNPLQPPQHGQGPQMTQHGQGPQMPQHGQGPQMPQHGQGPQMPQHGQGPQMPQHGQGSQMTQHGQGPQMPQHGQGPQMPQHGQGPQMPSHQMPSHQMPQQHQQQPIQPQQPQQHHFQQHQPSHQQPIQPSHQQPSHQQPSHQQPSHQQPSHQQPSHQQPSHQQPSHQQPSHQQPSHQQPSHQQPSLQQSHQPSHQSPIQQGLQTHHQPQHQSPHQPQHQSPHQPHQQSHQPSPHHQLPIQPTPAPVQQTTIVYPTTFSYQYHTPAPTPPPTQAPTPSTPQQQCSTRGRPGRYAVDSSMCRSYLYCYVTGGSLTGQELKCPGTTTFNPDIQKCVAADTYTCASGAAPAQFI